MASDQLLFDSNYSQDNFTILIPVHNESKIILQNINHLSSYVGQTSCGFNILLIENGSVDGTAGIVKEAERNYKNVSSIALAQANLGIALSEGIRHAKNENLVYIPIDLSVGLDFIQRSMRLLNEYDIIVGSKRMDHARDDRPAIRRVCSIGYHTFCRILLGVKVTDSTCVKAYRRSKILPELRKIHFYNIFDTELLFRAQRSKCKIVEIPVTVSDRRLPRENLLLKIMRKMRSIIALKAVSALSGKEW